MKYECIKAFEVELELTGEIIEIDEGSMWNKVSLMSGDYDSILVSTDELSWIGIPECYLRDNFKEVQ